MASRKNLKKDIQQIFSDLLAECYISAYIHTPKDTAKADAIATSIIEKCDDLVKRAGKVDGKNNPQRVRTYYKKLYQDISDAVAAIIQNIQTLGK